MASFETAPAATALIRALSLVSTVFLDTILELYGKVTGNPIFDFTPIARPAWGRHAWRARPAGIPRLAQSAGCFRPPLTLRWDRLTRFHIIGCAPAAIDHRRQATRPA